MTNNTISLLIQALRQPERPSNLLELPHIIGGCYILPLTAVGVFLIDPNRPRHSGLLPVMQDAIGRQFVLDAEVNRDQAWAKIDKMLEDDRAYLAMLAAKRIVAAKQTTNLSVVKQW